MAETAAPDTGTETTPPADEQPAATDTETLQAEIEKWKAQARKHEDRAKANAGAAKELETLRQASMTEQERAVAEATAKARAETLREVGSKLVDAEVRAASAGRGIDVDALLEGLDRSRFLTDDGEPDRAAITAWVDRISPKGDEAQTVSFPDLGQGTRPGASGAPLGSDPLLGALKEKLGIG